MQARRARILKHARLLIIDGGVEGLSIRVLANSAGVAVRTIYSLIGRKDDVLIALFSEMQAEFTQRVHSRTSSDPLAMVEAGAVEASEMFHSDEDCWRAAYLAIEHLNEVRSPNPAILGIFDLGERLVTEGFQACIDAGLLTGALPAKRLGALALQSYRVTWRRWAAGQISLAQLSREALGNAHIVLLADATPSFRKLLLERMCIHAPLPASPLQRRRAKRRNGQNNER